MTGPYDIGDDAIHELEKEYERGYSDGIAAAARALAALRAEKAKLREALDEIANLLEQEGNSARRLNQDQNAKWEKWLKSRRGRQPYTTPGMDYAAEVMLSVSRQARAALALSHQ